MARTRLPRKGCQDRVASMGQLKQHGRNRKERTATRKVTSITGPADREGGTGQAEQDCQERTPGQDSRTGLPGQDGQNRAASTELLG